MRTLLPILLLAAAGCGPNLAGLNPVAAKELSCEENQLSTSTVRDGYAPDDFSARVEVSGCGNKATFEKKGESTWVVVTDVEPDE